MPAPSNTPSGECRTNLGERIHVFRARLGYSIETAARLGDVGHMTWRRIERGEIVQSKSYFAVDRVFGWDYGVTLRVAEGTGDLDELPDPKDTESSPSDTAPPDELPTRQQTADTKPAATSEAYRSVVRDLQQLNFRELQAVRRVVDTNADMFNNIAAEIRTALEDVPELRPYRSRYARTSPAVAHRYQAVYEEYSATWNETVQLAHDAEPLIYHNRFDELQALYAHIVGRIDQLQWRCNDLVSVEKQAESDLAFQEQQPSTEQETE